MFIMLRETVQLRSLIDSSRFCLIKRFSSHISASISYFRIQLYETFWCTTIWSTLVTLVYSSISNTLVYNNNKHWCTTVSNTLVYNSIKHFGVHQYQTLLLCKSIKYFAVQQYQILRCTTVSGTLMYNSIKHFNELQYQRHLLNCYLLFVCDRTDLWSLRLLKASLYTCCWNCQIMYKLVIYY